MSKNENRLRRAQQTRLRIAEHGKARLAVFRSNSHIYAQIIDTQAKILVSASTIESDVRKAHNKGGNKAAATLVGKRLAEKAKKIGIQEVAFDRSGYRYHGRVKALAEAAREGGLSF